jgi:hypothetical protein
MRNSQFLLACCELIVYNFYDNHNDDENENLPKILHDVMIINRVLKTIKETQDIITDVKEMIEARYNIGIFGVMIYFLVIDCGPFSASCIGSCIEPMSVIDIHHTCGNLYSDVFLGNLKFKFNIDDERSYEHAITSQALTEVETIYMRYRIFVMLFHIFFFFIKISTKWFFHIMIFHIHINYH